MQKTYKQNVEEYFFAEYSDYSIEEIIEQIRVFVRKNDEFIEKTISQLDEKSKMKLIRKWEDRIEKIINTYKKAKKSPTDAAWRIAKILNSVVIKDFSFS